MPYHVPTIMIGVVMTVNSVSTLMISPV
jgi:hypothetical protein